MNTIKKHWALIGFILAFLLERETGFLKLITENTEIQNIVKGLGAIILAYFWKNENTETSQKRARGIGARPNDRK